jgi:DNA-binding CsgD family transcriptional regulator
VEQRASGFRVARAAGVEYEMELPYAGLHQLCGPMLDIRGRLPDPQREAVEAAFGLSTSSPHDRFVVDLAVLDLLSEIAEEQPLVCVIDDAQWLDQASLRTLAFVARRLQAERVGLVFAVRQPVEVQELDGLPEIQLEGISDSDARALLDASWPGRLDDQVRERVIAESRGNPLALLELPRGLSSAVLAGGFELQSVVPLRRQIEQSFARQLETLPAQTRQFLLAAAAEPVGDVALLWGAASRLGLGADAAEPAQTAGLIELGARVRFRHPLVRSAVYQAASAAERQHTHRALAEATDPAADPDRRAWHLGHAATGQDESVADELERSAMRAHARGGIAAAAAFLQRAAELTPDATQRGRRSLAAAQAKLECGYQGAAWAHVAIAELSRPYHLQSAINGRLRAQVVFALRRGGDAPPVLLEAAVRLGKHDIEAARMTYLEALGAAVFAGRFNGSVGPREVASAVRAAPAGTRQSGPADLLLDALTTRFVEGYSAGVVPLKRALKAFERNAGSDDHDVMRWFWLAWIAAADMWDDEIWDGLTARAVRLCREYGALQFLPLALGYRAIGHAQAGEFGTAQALMEESDAITAATGNAPVEFPWGLLVAWRGVERDADATFSWRVAGAIKRGEGRGVSGLGYFNALLYNGLGRYDVALENARDACSYEDMGLLGLALAELVEAGVRSGATDEAAVALGRLEERASAARTPWALGTQARSRALLSEGTAADTLYREAIDHLSRSRVTGHLARAHLVYGEWLRRENRRIDARAQLRTAHEMFSRFGAEAYAERGRRELVAAGETPRSRTGPAVGVLTHQEAQIAMLARDGRSNPEIGAELFLSRHTVEWHLRKVFVKLDITSRRHLSRVPLSRLSPP